MNQLSLFDVPGKNDPTPEEIREACQALRKEPSFYREIETEKGLTYQSLYQLPSDALPELWDYVLEWDGWETAMDSYDIRKDLFVFRSR